jgi:hypothetical protein
MKRTTAALVAGLMLAGLLAPAVVAGHEYKWVPEHKTWHEAVDYCEQDGGHLATIGSKSENMRVWAARPHGQRGGSWLGASDEADEGVWEWVTGEPFTYADWAPGNPDDYGGGPGLGEDYLAFHGLFAELPRLPGVWIDWQYDDDGSWSRLPFTCEYE